MDPVQPDTKLPVSSLLASSRRWEATAVPLGRNLRIVSWVALAASTLTLVVTLVHWPLVREADHQRAFFLLGWSQVTWLAGPSLLLLVTALFVSLVLVAGSALLTSGFRIGGPRLQVTCAAADALALAAVLPASPVLAVYALNTAIWWCLAFIVTLPLTMTLALVFTLLDSYEDATSDTPQPSTRLSLGHLLESNAASSAAVSEHPAEPSR